MKILITINEVIRDTLNKMVSVYLSEKDIEIDLESITTEELYKICTFEGGESEFNEYFYQDVSLITFGHAQESYNLCVNDLNDFYEEMYNKYEITLGSKDYYRAKPSTHFFLSKYGCMIDETIFYKNNDIADNYDIIITASPSLFNKGEELGKEVYLVDCPYNQMLDTTNRFKDLKEIIEKLKINVLNFEN